MEDVLLKEFPFMKRDIIKGSIKLVQRIEMIAARRHGRAADKNLHLDAQLEHIRGSGHPHIGDVGLCQHLFGLF